METDSEYRYEKKIGIYSPMLIVKRIVKVKFMYFLCY